MQEYQAYLGIVTLEVSDNFPRQLLLPLSWAWEQFLIGHPQLKGAPWEQNMRVALSLVSDAQIERLNAEYRGKKKSTDVLSFPSYSDLRQDPLQVQGPLAHLGDIVLAEGVAKKQSKEFGVTYHQELIHLAHHGWLHLLGFDHERSPAEAEEMEQMEQILLDLSTIAKRL